MTKTNVSRTFSLLLFSFVVISYVSFVSFSPVKGSLVVGVDYGTESFKVAQIQGGNIDLVLNSQSGRKTLNAVGFDDKDERFFADAALRFVLRKPSRVAPGAQHLIGRRPENPIVQNILKRHPFDLFPSTERGGVVEVRLDQNTTFHPEELVAMVLENVQTMASGVKDIVITVPPFFSEFERQGLLDAIKLAGLNPLMLMNEGVAVAQQWAISRDFPEEEQNVIFYDLGAGSLKVTVVGFRKIQDSSKNKPIPHLSVKAATWDEALGGVDFDICLAEHIANLVNKKRPGEPDVRENLRVMMRIRKESRTIKEILSANQAYLLSIESLIGDFDFSTQITRQEFEDACADVFAKVLAPLERAVLEANLTLSEVHGIELVGGASRIPKVQEILKKYLGRDLDHHLNGDEAAVFGATFQAAVLSPGFKVPTEYRIKDITPYEVALKIEAIEKNVVRVEGEVEEEEQQLQDTLFKKGKRLNSRRTVSFRMGSNFTIDLFYNGTDVPLGAPKDIRTYTITGVPTAETLANLTGTPKINVSFQLNRNGIVEVIRAEAEVVVSVFEEVRVNKTEEKSSTEDTSKKTESNGTVEESEKKDEERTSTEEKKEEEKKEEKKEGEETPDTKTETVSEPPVLEPVLKKRRIPLKVTWKASSVASLSDEQYKEAVKTLRFWNKKDQTRRETEEAKNSLESYIYATKERLYDDDFVSASTEEEREKLSSKLSEYGDWLYDEGDNAGVAEYRKKLRELKELGDAIQYRLDEQKNRPQAAADLRMTIDIYRRLLSNMTNLYNITEEEINEALDQGKQDEEWLNTKEKEQESKSLVESPAFTSMEAAMRVRSLQATISRLQRKPKRKPPPTPTKSPKTSAKGKTTTSNEKTTAEEEGGGETAPTTNEETIEEKPTSEEQNNGAGASDSSFSSSTSHEDEVPEVENVQKEAENVQL